MVRKSNLSIPFKTKLALVAVILFWASAFVGIRAGLLGYSPGGLALLRFVIASIVMYFIYLRRKERAPIQFQDLLLALFTGAIGIGLYNIALNYGELVVSSSMASFIVSQSPVVTTILAFLFLRERVTGYTVLGMMISGIGVALICVSSDSKFDFYIGIVFVMISTVVGSLYSILQKSLLQKHNAIDLTAYAIWGGTLILLIFIPDLIHDIKHASIATTLTVVYLGIFPAALTYLAWNYVLSVIPASRAVSFLYCLPIVATFIGWLWLGEVPAVLAFVGGLIALLGVWLVNHSFKIKPVLTKT